MNLLIMGWTWNSKNALQKMVSANKMRTRCEAKDLEVMEVFFLWVDRA
jgi:hypothetical protein